jgi:hypothetical protein
MELRKRNLEKKKEKDQPRHKGGHLEIRRVATVRGREKEKEERETEIGGGVRVVRMAAVKDKESEGDLVKREDDQGTIQTGLTKGRTLQFHKWLKIKMVSSKHKKKRQKPRKRKEKKEVNRLVWLKMKLSNCHQS